MLDRVLEPEVMDSEAEAHDYDAMDHAAVNRVFVADFLTAHPGVEGVVLDVGTGTAQIPIELCRQASTIAVVAVDAAEAMIAVAVKNVAAAGLVGRVRLELANARSLPYPGRHFAAVVSNSIVHHISDPAPVLAEMVRICRPGGALFVRDLLRPDTEAELTRLVELYTAGANDHQRRMFADSLRAALTVAEVRDLVGRFGFPSETVRATSDRHWTWSAVAG